MAPDAKALARDRAAREAQGLHHLLTTAETAAALRVSESLLKHGRLAGRSDLPPALQVGHRVMYRQRDVQAWAKARANGQAYKPPRKQPRKGKGKR